MTFSNDHVEPMLDVVVGESSSFPSALGAGWGIYGTDDAPPFKVARGCHAFVIRWIDVAQYSPRPVR